MNPAQFEPLNFGPRDQGLLTASEERDLNLRRVGGDKTAREQLILRNVGLAIKVGGDFSGSRPGLRDDAISEAIVGLVEAVDSFDHGKGRLATHACLAIRRRVFNFLAEFRNPFRMTPRVVRSLRRIDNARDTLMAAASGGCQPSVDELAEAAKVSPKAVLSWLGICGPLRALDEYAEGPGEIAGTLDGGEPRVKDMRELLTVAVEGLGPKEKDLISARFGLGKYDTPQTLEKIAVRLRVTRERVRQIEMRAMRKMRWALRGQRAHDERLAVLGRSTGVEERV